MQAFTDNFEVESTEQGFQSIFKCETRAPGYKSAFVASDDASRKAMFDWFSRFSRFGSVFSSKAPPASPLGPQERAASGTENSPGAKSSGGCRAKL
jgi:hypothetical protein